jgi:hypothetical protein
MSFEEVERLKNQYTDKYVAVDASAPELKRFVGLTGQVKTVNMNGRALVQFDGAVDISWYDIDLAYLSVVDKKPAKPGTAAKHDAAEKPSAPAEKKGATAKAGGKSPLEMARAQGAAGSGKGAATASAPTGEKPLSKLEQARLQGASKGGAAPSAAAPAAPPAASAPPAGGKPLSKLEQARLQGAAKAGAAAPAAAPPPAAAAAPVVAAAAPEPEAPPAPEPEVKPAAAAPKPAVSSGGKPLSKIELARQQGAFKGDK